MTHAGYYLLNNSFTASDISQISWTPLESTMDDGFTRVEPLRSFITSHAIREMR